MKEESDLVEKFCQKLYTKQHQQKKQQRIREIQRQSSSWSGTSTFICVLDFLFRKQFSVCLGYLTFAAEIWTTTTPTEN